MGLERRGGKSEVEGKMVEMRQLSSPILADDASRIGVDLRSGKGRLPASVLASSGRHTEPKSERIVVKDSASTARGLRAHKDPTRKVVLAERQLGIRRDPTIIAAIRRKAVLRFSYNGTLRTVEPQTYGLSRTGREVLRAYERPAIQDSKRSGMAKLFDLSKIFELRETGQTFREALPAHNPDDSAMVEVFATLPVPKR